MKLARTSLMDQYRYSASLKILGLLYSTFISSSTLLHIRATIINAANIPCDAIRNATCDLRCHNTRTSSLNDRIVPRSLIYALFLYNILLIRLCPPSHSIVARCSDQTTSIWYMNNFRLKRTNFNIPINKIK